MSSSTPKPLYVPLSVNSGTGEALEKVGVRPGVSILSILRHLNYMPWFALAEFVDNSLQSFLEYREALEEVEGEGFRLKVSIEVDSTDDGRIIIRDNAAGIHKKDYARAFRPAAIPPDRSGLSEFGMGMKSAACWFAPRWMVRTSALGEPVERTVWFDVERIVNDSIEELEVQVRPISVDAHFTEIVLLEPFRLPRGSTVRKIKEHLTDIYRIYTRSGELELWYDGELLEYKRPKVLVAPYFKTPDGKPVRWRKEIDFDFGGGLRVHGFAALRETGNTRRAGFALFRRNRLIQGSGDNGYKPYLIFGTSNSYRHQRLFGELHLEGFEVSHTKDGFKWDENEEPFLELLREKLDEEPLPLLRQAEHYRASRHQTKEIQSGAEEAAGRTAETIERDVPAVMESLDGYPSTQSPPEDLPTADLAARRIVNVRFRGEHWQIILELTNDPAIGDWLTISNRVEAPTNANEAPARRLGVRLSLAHPFMMQFGGIRAAEIEPLLRVAAGLALAEEAAYAAGIKYASTIRRYLNELLREGLSRP